MNSPDATERFRPCPEALIPAFGLFAQPHFNITARAYDYTPPVLGLATVADDAGRPGGGADLLFDLMERRIKPRIQDIASLDHSRQTLWGHSYGGPIYFACVVYTSRKFQPFSWPVHRYAGTSYLY